MKLPKGKAEEVILMTDASGTGRGLGYRFGRSYYGNVHGHGVIGPFDTLAELSAAHHAAYEAVTYFPFPNDTGERGRRR